MQRLIKSIFWTFLFLVLLLAIDQFLVQVRPLHPAHAAIRNFYQDFRSRLIDLAFGDKKIEPESIEAVIEKQQQKEQKASPELVKKAVQDQTPPVSKTPTATNSKAEESSRYLYSDGKGELHFVDSLDDVPDEFRGQAQPMGR